MLSVTRNQEHRYHENKKVQVELLLKDVTTKPSALTSFVSNYDSDLRAPVSLYRQKQAVVDIATEHYLKLCTDEIKDLRNNSAKSLQDLSNLLERIIEQFPNGDKSIIHYQDNPVYALFCQEVVDALAAKRNYKNPTGDRYNKYIGEPHAGQCVEALLIQHIAKCRIPLKVSSNYNRLERTPLSAIMQNLLARSQSYFETNNQINHAIFTLAALTNIDINSFATQERERSYVVSYKVVNHFVDPLVNKVVEKLNATLPPHVLVRALHAIILLSRADDNFKTYLSDNKAKQILGWVADQLKSLPVGDTKNRNLAQQLFQIRNIYTEVFPASLTTLIEPHISTFAENTHGSHFEKDVFSTLIDTATALKVEYPKLIDSIHFSANNPICDALGLESDITYENGAIKTCIQVDGDKYHTYNGTKTPTQRTLLRDHCFKKGHWKLIKFTDADCSEEKARMFLLSEIIVPTFEAKLSSILDFATAPRPDLVSPLLESKQVADALSLVSSLPQVKALLATASAKRIDVSSYQKDIDLLSSFATQVNIAHAKVQSYKKIFEEVREQLSRLDLSKVKTFAHISKALEISNNKVLDLTSDFAKQEKLAEQTREKLVECQTDHQIIQEELSTIEKALATTTSKIEKFTDERLALNAMERRLNADVTSRSSSRTAKEPYQGLSRVEINTRREEIALELMPLNANQITLLGNKHRAERKRADLEQTIEKLNKKQSECDMKIKDLKIKLATESEIKQSFDMALKNVEYLSLADKIEALQKTINDVEELSTLLQDSSSKLTMLQSIEKSIKEKLAKLPTLNVDAKPYYPPPPVQQQYYYPSPGYFRPGGYITDRGLFYPNNSHPFYLDRLPVLTLAPPQGFLPQFNGATQNHSEELKQPELARSSQAKRQPPK